MPDHRTPAGHRRYDLTRLAPERFRTVGSGERKTVAYTRVSSSDQCGDLERQKQVLENYCAAQGWTFDQGEDAAFKEDLVEDVRELAAVFAARLYGVRSHKGERIIKALEVDVADEAAGGKDAEPPA